MSSINLYELPLPLSKSKTIVLVNTNLNLPFELLRHPEFFLKRLPVLCNTLK